MRSRIALLTLALVLGACGGEGDQAETTDAAAPTATPSSTPTATVSPTPSPTFIETSAGTAEDRTIDVDGSTRDYLLFIPPTLDRASPAPLVVSLHGGGLQALAQLFEGFNATAETHGIVVVYPDAVRGFWDLEGSSDVDFITAVVDEVSGITAIDPGRIYAIGYSNGGTFSTYLACRTPDRIAAVASVAMLHHHDAPACETPSPARVLSVVGETDGVYSIELGLIGGLRGVGTDEPGPLADEAAAWAETNGCDLEPTETPLSEGVVRRDYGCTNGAALVVYVHPGDHIWPKQDLHGLDANTIIWDFLQQYSGPVPAE